MEPPQPEAREEEPDRRLLSAAAALLWGGYVPVLSGRELHKIVVQVRGAFCSRCWFRFAETAPCAAGPADVPQAADDSAGGGSVQGSVRGALPSRWQPRWTETGSSGPG